MQFEWREGARSGGVDVQAVGERLLALREQHPKLPPDAVVDDARSPESPLHPYFEWDDDRAAHSYRLNQARQLVACVVMRERPESEPVRVFVNMAERDENDTRGYMTRVEVLSDEELRRRALLKVLTAAFGEMRDYANEPEIAPVVRAITVARKRLGERTSEVAA